MCFKKSQDPYQENKRKLGESGNCSGHLGKGVSFSLSSRRHLFFAFLFKIREACLGQQVWKWRCFTTCLCFKNQVRTSWPQATVQGAFLEEWYKCYMGRAHLPEPQRWAKGESSTHKEESGNIVHFLCGFQQNHNPSLACSLKCSPSIHSDVCALSSVDIVEHATPFPTPGKIAYASPPPRRASRNG